MFSCLRHGWTDTKEPCPACHPGGIGRDELASLKRRVELMERAVEILDMRSRSDKERQT